MRWKRLRAARSPAPPRRPGRASRTRPASSSRARVDEVARLLHHPDPHGEVLGHLLHEAQVAPGGEGPTFTLHDDDTSLRVAIDLVPDGREIAMHLSIGSVQLARRAHDQTEDAGLGTLELQAWERVIAVGHGETSSDEMLTRSA